MKTALIIGINGNFGSQMASELAARGWRIRALLRDKGRAPKWLNRTDIVQGDACDPVAVNQAADGAELLVYAANPPYHRWSEQALAMLEPAVAIAQARQLTLLFPGNVYGFAPQSNLIDEAVLQRPPTEKGRIRRQMETRLQQASERGARVLILRAGDFIGQDTSSTWVDLMLKMRKDTALLRLPHGPEHCHYWSYLPDLCANAAMLLERMDQTFEVYHDPGLALSTEDWRRAFVELGGKLRLQRFPWWALAAMRPFSPMIREVWAMRYLWQQPVLMDGQRLRDRLGAQRQQTPLNDILLQVLPASFTVTEAP